MVLVVEPDKHVAQLVQANLERAGYKVVWASDTVDALAKARSLHPELVLVNPVTPSVGEFVDALQSDPATCDMPVKLMPSTTGVPVDDAPRRT